MTAEETAAEYNQFQSTNQIYLKMFLWNKKYIYIHIKIFLSKILQFKWSFQLNIQLFKKYILQMYKVRSKNSTNDLKRFQTVTAVKYISIINLMLILVLLKLSDRRK